VRADLRCWADRGIRIGVDIKTDGWTEANTVPATATGTARAENQAAQDIRSCWVAVFGMLGEVTGEVHRETFPSGIAECLNWMIEVLVALTARSVWLSAACQRLGVGG